MQISPEALSGGERLQLASLMLQAWATFQAQGQHAHTSRCDFRVQDSGFAPAPSRRRASTRTPAGEGFGLAMLHRPLWLHRCGIAHHLRCPQPSSPSSIEPCVVPP